MIQALFYYTAPQMRARTTPGFFYKSDKSKTTGFAAISLKRD